MFTVQFDENSKIPIRLPPTTSPDGSYHEQPIFDYDESIARRRSDTDSEFLNENDQVYQLPNVRRRRHDTEQARLLSQSAFNRISETLGALNTVGNFFLNMTREVSGDQHNRGDMQLISSSSMQTTRSPDIEPSSIFSIDSYDTSTQSVPDALLTITKNVLGQNMTKTIEPLIKRVGQAPEKESKIDKLGVSEKIDKLSLNEKIDMASLAEKKRKKHQAVPPKKEKIPQLISVSTTVSPGTFWFFSFWLLSSLRITENRFYRL